MKPRLGYFSGYGEMVVVAICVGIISSAPLGVHGETWAIIAWTAASNVASYVKGKLETKPGGPSPVTVENKSDDPVPVTSGRSKASGASATSQGEKKDD